MASDHVASAARCLLIVPDLARGGAERQAVLVGRALRDRGMDVVLFAMSTPDALVRDGLTGDLAVDITDSPGSLPRQLLRLRSAIERHRPGVVITFLRGAAARFALVRATSGVARRAGWIFTARGNIRLSHLARTPATFAAQLVWLRSADRICANSAPLASNLLTLDDAISRKLVVVPNIVQSFPVDLEKARQRVDDLVGGAGRRPVIGCIGSFQEERNYNLLADALPLVLRARPGAHALIIGRGSGPQVDASVAEFRRRVTAAAVAHRVTVAGEIPDARSLLPGFDVFALPSKLEGSSNVLAETMLAGVATAAVPVSDADELLAGAGIISRGWTAEAFSAAIVAALDGGDRLRGLASARGKALLVERSAERVGAEWAAVVEEAMAAAREREAPDRRADRT